MFFFSATGFLLCNGVFSDYFPTTPPGIPTSMRIKSNQNDTKFSFLVWERSVYPKHLLSVFINKKYLVKSEVSNLILRCCFHIQRSCSEGAVVERGFLGVG